VRQLDTAYQAAVAKFEMEHSALNVRPPLTQPTPLMFATLHRANLLRTVVLHVKAAKPHGGLGCQSEGFPPA
jgi:hypothetical protein